MAKIVLIKGENKIIRKTLLKADETPLLYADLANTDTKIVIYQRNMVVATFTKGTSPEIREGLATNELEFEITKALTLSLLGEYVIEYTLTVTNSDFDVDQSQIDGFKEPLEVVKNG